MSQYNTLERKQKARAAQGKRAAAGSSDAAEDRALRINILRLARPLVADEEASAAFQSSHRRFLMLAVSNYRRCNCLWAEISGLRFHQVAGYDTYTHIS